MTSSALTRCMKNGTQFWIEPCIEADTEHTREFLQSQILDGFDRLSLQSRWQRFISPINKLSQKQLDYLTRLDGRGRVAWCASTLERGAVLGIGLARYIKLADEEGVAEFAITVVDDYQGQGVGRELLGRLITAARDNKLEILRGYMLPSNRRMLRLCKHFGAQFRSDDPNFLVAEIGLGEVVN